MSSLNPAARAAAAANAAVDPVALEIAALKADADALRGLVASGDIVAAKVLPFNGLTDLIEILGKRVAASLPPTVRPGETLILEVTGFDGDHIVVRNLGIDPTAQGRSGAGPGATGGAAEGAAAETASASARAVSNEVLSLGARLPPPSAASSPAAAPRAVPAGAGTGEAPATPAPVAPGESAPAVAARTVFSDASVQQAIRPSGPSAGEPPPASGGAPAGNPRVTIAVPPRAIETDQSIEARLIAARTSPAPAIAAPAARPALAGSPAPAASVPAVAPGATPRPPPWIAPAARPPDAEPAAAATETTRTVPTALPATPRTAQTYRDPVVLLRSLRIPVTPTNVASAKLALETPGRLPVALAALERSLPLGNADARVNTLRTLAAFVTDLDPQSETFPAQLSAYIGNVIDGPEPKLAALLAAFADAETSALPDAAVPGQTAAAAPLAQSGVGANHAASDVTPAQPAAAPAQQPLPPAGIGTRLDVLAGTDPVAAAKVAERTTALAFDLKTVLQSFLAEPPPNASPGALSAAQTALAALTATQLNTAAAQQDPRAVTFTLPLPSTGNGAGAQIKISREKPDGKERLDSDNFHIAFILDTKNVGTVAVDLQTSGRAVTVAVKSETPRYAAAFKGRLEQLGGRLEKLRYNVVSLDSEVVSRAAATITTAAPGPAPQDDEPASGLDLRA